MRYNNQSMATSSFMTDATLEDKPASSADRIPAAESAADPETTGQGRKKALSPEDAYQELLNLSREVVLLESIGGVLGWDRDTQMPKRGANLRAEQTALLAGMAHRRIISPRIGELLDVAESGDLTANEYGDVAVNIREWRREYDRSTRVPVELIEEISKTTVKSQNFWAQAREKGDFSIFHPWLDTIVKLRREQAQYQGFEHAPYDAHLEAHEPGVGAEDVRPVFQSLGEDLIPLVNAISESKRKPRTDILNREFPLERQRIFGEAAARAIGYDFSGGRLDTSTHPFSVGLGPGDVRITTRYKAFNFAESLFGILHETGHAMYEQNLNPEHFGSPIGRIVSMGMHESQSRLWENFVGRSRPFWQHFFPRAQQIYPTTLDDVTFDEFYFAINNVEPSYIRVDADEVTYNLHILLRFDIEQALINGDLGTKDVPECWNETFSRYLGLRVENDRYGCLQDIHWAFGEFGYFPTYALGNIYAAQFYDAALRDIPDLESDISHGNFAPLLQWLREKIHCHGSRYFSHRFVEEVTGNPVSHRPMIEYLKKKFGTLYDL